jgi:glycosyltransferase involved in cell wall biosynthesis
MIVGGAQENTLLTIAGHLNNGHNATLITGPSPGPEGELLKKKGIPDGLNIALCPYLVREISPLNDIRAYFFLRKYFAENHFDIVHTHSSKAGIIARAAAASASVPVTVHTVHGLAFHKFEKSWKNFLYKLAERWAAKKCDKIFAVAQAMIDQCVSAKIANRGKFKVIYSGIELDSYRNCGRERNRIREKFKIPSDAPLVGAVARLFPLKGYEDFLPASAKIAKEINNVHFLIVGDGVMKDDVKKQSEDMGLKFHFAGLVPPEEVPSYVSAMDVLIHLSLREGLPRAVVQAFAAGKPAIAYRLDGSPEVIIGGKTGFLADTGDIDSVAKFAISILRNPQLASSLGTNGQKMVFEKFDWKIMVREIENEYFQLLK